MYMHFIHRLPIVAAGLLLTVSLVGTQLAASLVARNETAVRFGGVIDQAEDQHYHGRTVLRGRRLETGCML